MNQYIQYWITRHLNLRCLIETFKNILFSNNRSNKKQNKLKQKLVYNSTYNDTSQKTFVKKYITRLMNNSKDKNKVIWITRLSFYNNKTLYQNKYNR